MHIPDGFLNPATCAGTALLAGAGLAAASRKVTTGWNDRTVPLLGVMSAFVFAGQMVNFPVAGGTSGHLLGGVLAAVLLGPHAAAMILTVVVAVQCLFFQDGGVTALGANTLNMALAGVYGGYAVFSLATKIVPGPRGRWIGIAFGSWCSVLLAATACSLELAASGTAPVHLVLPAMLITHAAIGIGEASITLGVISFVARVRPDLIYRHPPQTTPLPVRTLVLAGLAASLGVAVLLAPLASSLPDGLEKVAETIPLATHGGTVLSSPLADYQLPGIASPLLSTILAAVVGTVCCLLLGWGAARLVARWSRRSSRGSEA